MRVRLVHLAFALGGTGCDFGIGSDPNPGHVDPVCAPGHSRTTPSEPCMTALAPAIAIDGNAADWAAVPSIPITGGTLAFAGDIPNSKEPGELSDLLLRGTFAGGPLDTLVIDLAPSAARPASGGTDHMTVDAAGIHYEKNGLAIVPNYAELTIANTPDGFEAWIDAYWLTYQGAVRMQIVGTRGGSEVLRGEAIDVCFGYRAGAYKLPHTACEVTP